MVQSYFGYRATLAGTARAADPLSSAFVLQMLELQTAARQRLMQCNRGLESCKSNYDNRATEVKSMTAKGSNTRQMSRMSVVHPETRTSPCTAFKETV